MADIRINALATTAASTASDDFVAVDGSANGTRKLNAFSPTFGGNLTVSGTGTQAFSGAIQTTGGIGTTTASSAILDYSLGARVIARGASAGAYGVVKIAGTDSAGSAAITGGLVATFDSSNGATTLAGNLTVSGTGTSSVAGSFGVGGASPVVGFSGNEAAWVVGANRTDGGSGLYPILLTLNDTRAYNSTNPSPGGGLGFTYKYNAAGNYAAGVTIQGFKENTTDGNYAGAMRFLTRANGANPAEAARITSGGNFLIGTTTDGGQKLQVSGDIAVGSGNPFSNAATKFSFTSSTNYAALALAGGAGTGSQIDIGDGAIRRAVITGEIDSTGNKGKLIFRTNAGSSATSASDALTLDSSQNATFESRVRAKGALIANGNVGSPGSIGLTAFFDASGTYSRIGSYNFTTSAWSDLTINEGGGTVTINSSSGNTVIGNQALATNATTGFFYVAGCAGTPTGTPTSYTGRVPIVVDTTNNKLYFYSGGAWRDAGP